MNNLIPELPYRKQFAYLAQDSAYKGLRIVKMEWVPSKQCWRWDRYFYNPSQLQFNHWEFVSDANENDPDTI